MKVHIKPVIVEQPGAVSSGAAKKIAELVANIMSDPERAADFERWQAERRKKAGDEK